MDNYYDITAEDLEQEWDDCKAGCTNAGKQKYDGYCFSHWIALQTPVMYWEKEQV